MNRFKLTVALLLVGVVIIGSGQVLQLGKVSGVVTSYSSLTSYSTWTSTFYSYLYGTTSTRFSTVTVTTDRLAQTSTDGPYVRITGTWGVFVEGKIQVQATIKSLISLDTKSGVIRFDVVGLRVHRDDIELTFGSIRANDSIAVDGMIGLPGLEAGAKVTPLSVGISLSKEEEIVAVTPVETYARTGTVTETHRKILIETYTVRSAYTVEEPVSTGNIQVIVVLVLVAAVAAGVAFAKLRKRSGVPRSPEASFRPQIEPPAPPPTAPMPKAKVDETPAMPPPSRGVKYCVHCGAAIPDVVTFCTKCGKKQ